MLAVTYTLGRPTNVTTKILHQKQRWQLSKTYQMLKYCLRKEVSISFSHERGDMKNTIVETKSPFSYVTYSIIF